MIKVHCNICDKVIEKSDSEGSIVVVSSLDNNVVFLYIRPMFKKKVDKEELEFTILQRTKKLEDSIETGHTCSECILKLLSNPTNKVLGK